LLTEKQSGCRATENLHPGLPTWTYIV